MRAALYMRVRATEGQQDTDNQRLQLRQQAALLKQKRPPPNLSSSDRLVWTILRRIWSRWTGVLVIVEPDTVVAGHRAGFRPYWHWWSRRGEGRPKITDEIRVLMRRLLRDYIACSQEDRIHDAPDKDTPHQRPVERKPAANATVISIPRLGGLHQRYAWREAAERLSAGRQPAPEQPAATTPAAHSPLHNVAARCGSGSDYPASLRSIALFMHPTITDDRQQASRRVFEKRGFDQDRTPETSRIMGAMLLWFVRRVGWARALSGGLGCAEAFGGLRGSGKVGSWAV